MKLACVFTGQGSQFAGMGQVLEQFDSFEATLDQFQKGSALPLKQWLFDTPDDVLQRTEIAQPAIYFHGWMAYQAFIKQVPPQAWVYAGHSLGEYVALAAAGVLDAVAALRVVHVRGKLMQEVCPVEFGGMAAVMMSNGDDVMAACETISREFGEDQALAPANFNSDRQVVVSGRLECIQILSRRYKEFGLLKVIPLKVSAPFHSKYMTPMKTKFREPSRQAICRESFLDLPGWYIPNVTAELLKIATLTANQIHHLLLEQLDHAVRWDVTAKTLGELEQLDAIVEFGPKAVVGPMMKSFVSCPIYYVGSSSDLEQVRRELL